MAEIYKFDPEHTFVFLLHEEVNLPVIPKFFLKEHTAERWLCLLCRSESTQVLWGKNPERSVVYQVLATNTFKGLVLLKVSHKVMCMRWAFIVA